MKNGNKIFIATIQTMSQLHDIRNEYITYIIETMNEYDNGCESITASSLNDANDVNKLIIMLKNDDTTIFDIEKFIQSLDTHVRDDIFSSCDQLHKLIQ